MASVSDRTRDPLAVAPWGRDATQESKSEQYLARRFAAASADLKAMALANVLLALAVGILSWFLLGVLIEHWLVPGGFAGWARWAWFTIAAAATVVVAGRWLVPLIRYRVNLVYAARELERGHPDLHNDLVNAVLVRERPDGAAEPVVKSLRRRAARRLSGVSDDGVVDRTPAVWLAWALSTLVCLSVLYAVLAPKSLVVSAARLVAPWTGMAAPARVGIEQPQLAWRVPGEEAGPAGPNQAIVVVAGKAELVRGRQLVVSALIDGLETDERPLLVVTPLHDDGTIDASRAPWQTPLVTSGTGTRSAVVPGPDRGLDHGVELQVVAGDGRSERVRVAVIDAPTFMVRELRYEYPDYMHRESESLPWQGDIRGVEGTRVTIVAEANRPLDAAAMDLGCDGRRNVGMTLERPAGTIGKATLALELNTDRTGPRYSSYRFIYRPRSEDGQPTQPDVIGQIEHRIEVTPDVAPEVAIEVPEEKVLRVPPDAPVTVRIRAVDPDFGLTKVHVETRLAGGEIRKGEELIVGPPRLRFHGAATLVPKSLSAGPGNRLEYRAVAIDTRPEKPNRTVTEWRALEIDASAPPQEPPPPEAGGEQAGDGEQPEGSQNAPGDGQPGDDRGDAGGNQAGDGDGTGQESQGEGQQGKEGQAQGEGQKGEGQKGEGQKGEGQKGEGQKGEGQKGEGQKGEGQKGEGQKGEGQKGEGQKGEGQKGEGQKGEGQKGEGQKGEGQKGEGQKGEGQKGEGAQESRGADGDQGSSSPKPTVAADGTDDGTAIERILENRDQSQETGSKDGGQDRDNGSMPGEGQPGEGQPGEGQRGEGQPGEGQRGEGQPGEGQPGEGQPGEGQPGEGQPGEGQPGEGQPGEGQPGEGQPGEGQPGEGQPGEGQPGEGKGQVGLGAQGGASDQTGRQGNAAAAAERREMQWTQQNLDHARNAANLAIEHLRDSLEEGRTDVIDSLGWTPEQAKAFLARWEQMQARADSPDPQQRGEYEKAVRSLGLRPGGVQSSRDVPTDHKGGQAEGRRSRPPSDYREQFKAFMQGTSVE